MKMKRLGDDAFASPSRTAVCFFRLFPVTNPGVGLPLSGQSARASPSRTMSSANVPGRGVVPLMRRNRKGLFQFLLSPIGPFETGGRHPLTGIRRWAIRPWTPLSACTLPTALMPPLSPVSGDCHFDRRCWPSGRAREWHITTMRLLACSPDTTTHPNWSAIAGETIVAAPRGFFLFFAGTAPATPLSHMFLFRRWFINPP